MPSEDELRNELQTLKVAVGHVAADLNTWAADVVTTGAFVGTHQDLAIRLIAFGRRLTDAVERHPADPHQSAEALKKLSRLALGSSLARSLPALTGRLG